nr:FCD domain-containing protein [Bowdeniella nasicola]
MAQANSFLQQHNAAVEAGQVDDARVAHRKFHFSLYAGAGSEWLVRGIEPAWQNAERYLFAAPDIDVNHDQGAVEHAEILAACSEHDSKRAARAIREHILGARDRIATQLQESQIFVKAR